MEKYIISLATFFIASALAYVVFSTDMHGYKQNLKWFHFLPAIFVAVAVLFFAP